MGHHDLDLAAVARLDDVALMVGLQRLVQQDRALTARLLVHLGEVDARGLYREQAYSSMFEYAVEALHMSPDEAYVRLRAAKVAREFPLVVQMLEKNDLHLTAIKLLAPHLTQANHVEVLERARTKSKREVEVLVAELAPKADVPSVVRKLPSARVVPQPVVEPAPEVPPIRELRLEAPAQAQVTTPLSPGRYKVQFTATQVLHDKLQQLKDLMRHQIPDGDLCTIFERAADLLIEQQMKRRFAQTKKPRLAAADVARGAAPDAARPATPDATRATTPDAARATTPDATRATTPDAARATTPDATRATTRDATRATTPDAARAAAPDAARAAAPDAARAAAPDAAREAAPLSRYVPRAVVREVYARDGGQCTFLSPDGRRCRARDHLELHHEDPFARGGPPTVENLRLLCHAHNALLAERDFGRADIEAKRRRFRSGTGSTVIQGEFTQHDRAPTDKRLKAQRMGR